MSETTDRAEVLAALNYLRSQAHEAVAEIKRLPRCFRWLVLRTKHAATIQHVASRLDRLVAEEVRAIDANVQRAVNMANAIPHESRIVESADSLTAPPRPTTRRRRKPANGCEAKPKPANGCNASARRDG